MKTKRETYDHPDIRLTIQNKQKNPQRQKKLQNEVLYTYEKGRWSLWTDMGWFPRYTVNLKNKITKEYL